MHSNIWVAHAVLWISGAVAAAGALSHLLAYQVPTPVSVALALVVRICMLAYLPLAALMVVAGEGLLALLYMAYPLLALVILAVGWPAGAAWYRKRARTVRMGTTAALIGTLLTVASALPGVPAAASVMKWRSWGTANQSTAESDLEDAYQRGIHGEPHLLYALSSNPRLPERLCAGVLQHAADDPNTKNNVVSNLGCPPRTWTVLAKDPNPSVRAHLVRSTRCPEDVLAQLAIDADEHVRAALAERRGGGAAVPDGGTRGE